MSNTNFIKPIAMAGCVLAGDKYILGETNMNRSMWLAGAGAAGVFASQVLAPLVPLETILTNNAFMDSKTL